MIIIIAIRSRLKVGEKLKYKKYLLLFLLMFCMFFSRTYALTIRETSDPNDEYSTLEEGSIIVGVTRFSSDNVVTAGKAAMAGANDAMLYVLQNGTANGYETPGVYYYVDSYVGWFFLDSDNKVTEVTDPNELEMLSKLDIYYVDNVEKVFEVELNDEDIDDSSLPDGVVYKDNKLLNLDFEHYTSMIYNSSEEMVTRLVEIFDNIRKKADL